MKKLWIPLVVLAVLCGGAYLFFERGVRSAIEEGGEYALGVETRVDGVRLGLFDGNVQLRGLEVENPAGFPADRLVTFGAIEAAVPPRRLLDDVVEVDKVVIDGADFRLDIAGLATNVDAILAHLEEVVGPLDTPSTSEPKRFRIRELVMKDLHAEVNLGSESLALDLPPIVLRDFESNELGLTIPDLVALVMHALVDSAVAAGGDTLPPEVTANLKVLTHQLGLDLGELVDGAAGLGGAAQGVLDEALGEEYSGKAQEALQKGLGSLLGDGD